MDISTEYVKRCAASAVDLCLNRFHHHWQKQPVSREQKEDAFKALISHIEKFPVIHLISEARKNIHKLRNQCLLIENDNQQFPQMVSEEYSENLLQEHIIEIHRLELFYKQNKALLDKLTRYEEMWHCHCNLQAQAHNPERLFHNRGAHLLKEEQDRKVSNQLPILRKNLLREMARREAEGNPLLVRGVRFCDLVERQTLTHKENVTVPTKRKREISPVVKQSSHTLQKKKRFQSSVKSTNSPLQVRREQTLSTRLLPKGRRPVSSAVIRKLSMK